VIEYPDIPSLPDYVIIDQDYKRMKQIIKPAVKPSKSDPTVDKKA
jgi:hypothetical protein